jgi:hypothetical protein
VNFDETLLSLPLPEQIAEIALRWHSARDPSVGDHYLKLLVRKIKEYKRLKLGLSVAVPKDNVVYMFNKRGVE